ncbi:MAG: aldo/keto reductase [Bacteroidales bacterium]|nr:aldo/keto reductase [Bacteroidales bacterium]
MEEKKIINRREFIKRLGLVGGATAATMFLDPVTSVAKNVITPMKDVKGENKMTYRVNRNTNDKVSLLGFGMMRLPSENKVINQNEVNRMVDYAIANGVNYFDTAPVYHGGKSETATGIALKRHDRSKFFVATKLSNFDKRTWTREASEKMYHDSFKNLQVDVIDYYLLHSIGGNGENELKERFEDNGMMDFLVSERSKGHIRNLGFSYHGDVKVFDKFLSMHKKYHWDFVQIQMNYVDWRHASITKNDWGGESDGDAEYLYNKLTKMNIPVVIMEPLRGGRLANVPEDVAANLKKARPEDSIASWAFRWCGTYPNVLTALSGMSREEHLQDNIKTFSPLEPCTESENALLAQAADLIEGYPTVPCTQCNYCMPCPFGVDIPKNFAYYNGQIDKRIIPLPGKQAKDYAERAAEFKDGFHKALTTQEDASRCRDCGVCLAKCPQKIRIPNQLQRIKEILNA